jgi:hypothetical protein
VCAGEVVPAAAHGGRGPGATDRGVIIINTTQCLRGTVSKVYATGEVGASVLAIREGILLNGSGVNGYIIVNE